MITPPRNIHEVSETRNKAFNNYPRFSSGLVSLLRIYFRSDRVHCINQQHSDWWVEKKIRANLMIK